MAAVTCGRVREVLSGVVAGQPVEATDDVWPTLLARGALQGSPSAPRITPVGQHVLGELEVRAYRTDLLPLDALAEQLTRVLTDLDAVAKTAEYFLAELGPVTPPEAVPLLRPVAVGLANRRGTTEELAEEFRNVWGSVEVMGGDSRDRLLAAELLHAASVPMDQVYAPLMNTTIQIREKFGNRARAVTSAALLQLHPGPDGKPAFPAFVELRQGGMTEEEAALLAGLAPTAAETRARREQFMGALANLGLGVGPAPLAATYLTACGEEVDDHAARIAAIASRLKGRLPDPVTPAAILSALRWLEPGELVNWAEKANEIARVRQLAPTPPELLALGIALVHGLPHAEFASATATTPAESGPRRVSAGLLAVHGWVYRPLVAAAMAGAAPSRSGSAS